MQTTEGPVQLGFGETGGVRKGFHPIAVAYAAALAVEERFVRYEGIMERRGMRIACVISVVVVVLAGGAGFARAAAGAPANAAAGEEGAIDFAALADELEPPGETTEVRLARQRAENAAVAIFTLPTVPIDPEVIRFRTSFYPVVHRAVARRATEPAAAAPHPSEALAAAAAGAAGRTALVPGLVAEHFALFRRADEDLSEADRLMLRQTSFYVAALERIAAVRISAAGGLRAVAAAAAAEKRADFLAIGAIGERFVEQLGSATALAQGLAGLGFSPEESHAAAVAALRSLGGPAPSSQDLALLGLGVDTPQAQAVAGLGAIVLPFAVRAAGGEPDGFADRFLEELNREAGSKEKVETDLRARSTTVADAAVLLTYVVKRIGVDAELNAARLR